MKNKFLFTLLVTSLCLLIFAIKSFAQEDYTTKSFKVTKGGALKVEISGGDIQIRTGNDNEVKVAYEADDDNDNVTLYQDGNNITVRSDDYIDFEITVPSEFNLNLNTAGGDIEVLNNIKGKVNIVTSGGDLKLKDVSGKLTAATAGGEINCGNVRGDANLSSSGGNVISGSVDGECKIATGGGNVIVSSVKKELSISTGGGNIDIGNAGSNANVVTGGGNVSVKDVAGVLTLTTGGGNISGNSVGKGGSAVTGGGNIKLENVSGPVELTSGAGDLTVHFMSTGNDDSRLTTGFGNITVYIPEEAKATIEAYIKFSDGYVLYGNEEEISRNIKSEFKSSSEDFRKGEYRAVYMINGGGPTIHLETSMGLIEIKKSRR